MGPRVRALELRWNCRVRDLSLPGSSVLPFSSSPVSRCLPDVRLVKGMGLDIQILLGHLCGQTLCVQAMLAAIDGGTCTADALVAGTHALWATCAMWAKDLPWPTSAPELAVPFVLCDRPS